MIRYTLLALQIAEKPMTTAQLAEQHGVRPQTLNPIVSALATDGLIRAEQARADYSGTGRTWLARAFVITDRGRRMLDLWKDSAV